MKKLNLLKKSLWAIGLSIGSAGAEGPAKEGKRPNVVFILVDDLRWDALGCMGSPFLQTPNIDRIAKEGVLFQNAFTTVSLCSPSRAGFLTGTYPQRNGVKRNDKTDPLPSTPTMGSLLQQAGYETAFIGKWHMNKGAAPRPGFNYWLSFDGQGVYIDPVLNENGTEFKKQGYITDMLTDYAVNWLNKPHDKPFLLYLSHKAVHEDFIPAERSRHLYEGVQLPEPPNWKDTLEGKPEWQRAGWVWGNTRKEWINNKRKPVPPVLPPEQWNSDLTGTRLKYFQTLGAVDDGIGEIFKTLETLGDLDNTVVIFASDNGFRLPGGARVRSDKRTAHEESIRIPFLLRYPPLAKPGTKINQMVLNIDLLPTLLDLAGAEIPANIQGQSFKLLLTGQNVTWRTAFLYEYFMEDGTPGIPGVYAVRTEKWKYMMYPDIKEKKALYDTLEDMDELYDLAKDPYELKNIAGNPEYVDQLKKLKIELNNLLKSAEILPESQ